MPSRINLIPYVVGFAHSVSALVFGYLVFTFALALPAVAVDLPVTIQVVDERGIPIVGATASIDGETIVRSLYEPQSTDASGSATFMVGNPFGYRYFWRISAPGFENLNTERYSISRTEGVMKNGQRVPKTIRVPLKRLTGEFVSVSVRAPRGPVGDAAVQLLEKGATGLNYSGNSDANGVAKIFLPRSGNYDLDVSAERYEPFRRSERIRLGAGGAEIDVELVPKPDLSTGKERLTSRITVNVTSGGKPLAGATVTARGHDSVTTKGSGIVYLTGSAAIGDQIQVFASADGFKTGSAIASLSESSPGIRGRTALGDTRIDLGPGKDPVADDTPVEIVIQVLDGKDDTTGVVGALVTLHLQNGTEIVGVGPTGRNGRIAFDISDSPNTPLVVVRKGIRVDVKAPEGFKDTIRSISSERLMPSNEPVEYGFTLDRDPSASLRLTMKSLTERVGKLSQMWSAYLTDQRSLLDSAKAAAQARSEADSILKAIHVTDQILASQRLACEGNADLGAVSMKKASAEMGSAGVTAEQMGHALSLNLAQANSLVQRCGTGDGAQAKQKHLEAIQLLGRLGVLDKRAEALGTILAGYSAQSLAAQKAYQSATDRLSGFDKPLRTAREAQQIGPALNDSANAAYAEGISFSPIVKSEFRAVDQLYRSTSLGITDPSLAEIGAQLKNLGNRLAPIRFEAERRAVLAGYVSSIASDVKKIEALQKDAERFLADYKVATCSVDVQDDVRKLVVKAYLDAQGEILLDADLPGQAEQCMLRTGPCAQIGRDIRQLLVNGGIEEARTRIDAAKRQGCNVADLESEYSTYKDIRDAATYIYALNEACRFQDAVTWAKQLPGFASSSAIVAREMRQSNDGLAAKSRVEGFLQQAQLSANNGNAAGAGQNLRSAELEAGKFPCLMNLVNQVRAGLRLPVPKMEEIPTISVNKPPPGALIGKPEVTKSYREDGGSGSYTERRFGSDFAEFEREIPWEKKKVNIRFNYTGVPATLAPGKKYVITTTLTITESQKDLGCSNAIGSTVKVSGDVDVVSSPNVHCGARTGETEFEVRKNARRVEIHLGGAPMGANAIWKYGN